MTEPKELMILRRKGTEQTYMIYRIVDGLVCMCPADEDSRIIYGARRTRVKQSRIWNDFEVDTAE